MADRRSFPASGHVFVALVVSIALWAVMVYGTLAYLRRIAGGLQPFDLRPFGYNVEEARALLAALSQVGRDYYANVQLSLDNAYPFTFALSRSLLLVWLTMPGRVADRPLSFAIRAGLVAMAILTAVFDYVENSYIADMLATGPQVSAEVVAWASFWTQAKSLAALVMETLCILLSAFAFTRWWHRRRARLKA